MIEHKNLFQALFTLSLDREQQKGGLNIMREGYIVLNWPNTKMHQPQYLLPVFLDFEKFEDRIG